MEHLDQQEVGEAESHDQQERRGDRQEHQDHGQLPQRMTALAPADRSLGQQVAAEDHGPEHDRLAGHRDGGIRPAVGGVVPPDDQHVDVLQDRHHGERERGHQQIHDHALAFGARAVQDVIGAQGSHPARHPRARTRDGAAGTATDDAGGIRRPGPHGDVPGVGCGHHLGQQDSHGCARGPLPGPHEGQHEDGACAALHQQVAGQRAVGPAGLQQPPIQREEDEEPGRGEDGGDPDPAALARAGRRSSDGWRRRGRPRPRRPASLAGGRARPSAARDAPSRCPTTS